MITKVDVQRFGSFEDFVWDDSVREDGSVRLFKRLNLLYGRNYAGKTTFSRIVRCLEEGTVPTGVSSPEFVISTQIGKIEQDAIGSHNLDVRVYNRDFVDEHLSFLTDAEGRITPFAIVGGENKLASEKIAEYETRLGSVETESGLRFNHSEKLEQLRIARGRVSDGESALKARLTAKATQPPGGIKHNPLYRDPNYNRVKIEADIAKIRRLNLGILDVVQRDEKSALLHEVALSDIRVQLGFSPSFSELRDRAEELVTRPISPTQPLKDLLEDAILQAWVKSGIGLHRDERTTCGFCGQLLPSDLWEKLDAHFSQESDELETALIALSSSVSEELEATTKVPQLQSSQFYAANRDALEESLSTLNSQLKDYRSHLGAIQEAIEARRSDIFRSRVLPDIVWDEECLDASFRVINDLINRNNQRTDTLTADQAQARVDLRLSEVAQFMDDINLAAAEESIDNLRGDVSSLADTEEEVAVQVKSLERELELQQADLKDERKGAERVNGYLNHYFGHDGLRLCAIQEPESANYKFEIQRGTEPACNLSEGERSLVAFCYFIARLEDSETQGKELIVYVDDPVSSLDGNHIFFAYSLIESLLAKPLKNDDGSNKYRYRQLFISTHSLDFFKYLKRLSKPAEKHGGTGYFMVERGQGSSRLSPMPAYMKKYATEFNYLFGQIYNCREAENAKTCPDCFYGFGNNLRKFLEAYLFYRYPCQDESGDSTAKLRKFFGDDAAATALATRVTNELSHLEEIFDRSMQPVEVPEIPRLACFVLDKIYEKDPDQFNALLVSIGEAPKLDATAMTADMAVTPS